MSRSEPDEGQAAAYAGAAIRLGHATAVTWLAWVLARALALATLVLLTQALSADDLGTLLSALAAGALGGALATGGLPDATTRSASLGRESGFGRGDVRRALVRFAVTCPATLALMFAIVAGESGAVDWSLLASSSLLALTQGATMIVASIFRARGQAGRYALVTNLIMSLGRTVVAIAALAAGAGAGVVMWAFVAVNVAVIATAWEAAFRGLPSTSSGGEGTAALHIGGAVWSLVQNLDLVVVGLVVGAAGAGTYGVALRLAEFALVVLVAVAVLYLPEATRLARERHRGDLVRLYRSSSRWCALVALPIGGVGFIVAPELARLLTPTDAEAATTVLRILLPAYALQGALGLAYLTAVALGADRTIRLTALFTVPALLAVTVGFTELWGLTGAATATLLALSGLTVWWVVQARELLGALPFDALFGRALATCLVSWVAAGLGMLVTKGATPLVSLSASLLAALAGWLVVLRLAGALSGPELRALARIGQRGLRLSRA